MTLLSDETRADIQGFLTTGYGSLPVATYLFLRISDARRARDWIASLLPRITTTAEWPDKRHRTRAASAAVNVCFTAQGLAECGLPPAALCSFPEEFQEGITSPARSRILGDTDESAPSQWEFGGPEKEPIHALLLLHARDAGVLDEVSAEQRALLARTGGVAEIAIAPQSGYRPAGDYEPFGFHDGISQPKILGLGGAGVPTGEFILGYPNHYGLIPAGPVVTPDVDRSALLPRLENPYHADRALGDLGKNGSFVVYRKLRQDVTGFWQFMRQEAERIDPANLDPRMIELASRCVGRWPNGAPLAVAPTQDEPGREDDNSFGYAHDPDGLRCPIGAHIRRTHPRDDLKPYPTTESLSMSEAHRLLRRARVFGTAFIDPKRLQGRLALEADWPAGIRDDGQERGIHFFSVNASIKSQFEFVQQTWCNNPHFGGLYDNKDPLVGDNGGAGQGPSHMTIPGTSATIRTAALPRFVTVRAGAYFFMPSLTALRFLASVA
jgi:Dyp-type peroxidase family